MRYSFNMQLLNGIIACSLLHFIVGQMSDNENVDTLIDSIFKKPNTDGRNPDGDGGLSLQPSGKPTSGTADCECVPYYLCNNGTVIEDGMGLIDIRIDDGPCDYLSVCCGSSDRIPTPVTPKPDPDKPSGCGRRNPKGVGFRITGAKDNEAEFGEFPWMVALLREDTIKRNSKNLLMYQCGAALIHPQVVLTAAHCVRDRDKIHYKIRAGEWDTQTKNELYPHQDRDVKTIIPHKSYYSGGLHYDFAILVLDTPLDITQNVNVVCLPKQSMLIENMRCYASGWGKDVFGKEGKYQVILKKIDLPIVQRDQCEKTLVKRLGNHFKLHKTFICAGGEPGKDTCKGDGGSPLVCPIPGEDNKYFHAGIVSWGIGCGEDLLPGLYANVAEVADWIDKELTAIGLDITSYKY